MRIVLILATASLAVAGGCGTDDPSVVAAQRGRSVVVAGFLPLAVQAREVGADAVVVIDRTPFGDSPHDLALTPRQRDEIDGASQHEAFGWPSARYHLTDVALAGPDPGGDPEPDTARLAAVKPRLRDGSITTLFTETLSPDSRVDNIAEDEGLDTAVLDPYEGLTAREGADGATYRSVQLDNLRVLRDHLDCAT